MSYMPETRSNSWVNKRFAKFAKWFIKWNAGTMNRRRYMFEVEILWKKNQSKYATDTEKYTSFKPSSWFWCTGYIPYTRKPNLNIVCKEDSAPMKYWFEGLNLVPFDYKTHQFHVLHTLHFSILAEKGSFRFTTAWPTVLSEHLHACWANNGGLTNLRYVTRECRSVGEKKGTIMRM